MKTPGGSAARLPACGVVIAVVPVRMPGGAFVRLAQDEAPVRLDEVFAWASTPARSGRRYLLRLF
ncbi:hypothetical protein LGN17_01480 [Burkholderia sp. AU30280]|uniref:hypothetical protein n=1 Tax=Burkholderia sp. AU30280 TaxID=2879628 RepID=UPI001CF4824A|nr:hypothetical protein [Burkholderia sp. AU30280]MCA8271193.1 hypothetical protein [Burkholderia sp. AU30280]